ncbi:hypothetical protein EV426DRAFT_592902, partial [Tirmania nivea]
VTIYYITANTIYYYLQFSWPMSIYNIFRTNTCQATQYDLYMISPFFYLLTLYCIIV